MNNDRLLSIMWPLGCMMLFISCTDENHVKSKKITNTSIIHHTDNIYTWGKNTNVTYLNNKFCEINQEWDNKGKLLYTGYFSNDVKVGIHKSWENGYFECNYIDGKRHGTQIVYNASNKFLSINIYSNDVSIGIHREWENNKKICELHFKDGKYKKTINWYPNGTLREVLKFKDGKAHGKYRYWSSDGKILRACIYKSGQKSGNWFAWHKNGNIAHKVRYVNGIKNGIERTWYDNGQLSRVGYYDSGNRTGKWDFWFEDGSKKTE